MAIVSGKTLNAIRVGIIDIFGKKRGIPINGIAKDFTHGDMTHAVLKSLTKDLNVSITKIPVKVRSESSNMSFELKSLLKKLKKINKNGNDYEYLNISSSFVLPYDVANLGKNGIKLSDKVIVERLKTAIMESPKTLELPPQVPHILEELERISSKGTKIFVSASNKSKGFNVFSLADGVHTIGGCNGVTKAPISRFSCNPLVENYQNLPVYVTNSRSIIRETQKTALSLDDIIPINSKLASLSKKELCRKIATEQDYVKLKHYVDELYSSGKFKFDIDFMRFKLISSVDPNLRDKIFDLKKFNKIFEGKFDSEVLQYTSPQGTHCDLMFRQFFNMSSKSKPVIPIQRTTQIPNTLSGTSFAAPQGLNEAIRMDYYC